MLITEICEHCSITYNIVVNLYYVFTPHYIMVTFFIFWFLVWLSINYRYFDYDLMDGYSVYFRFIIVLRYLKHFRAKNFDLRFPTQCYLLDWWVSNCSVCNQSHNRYRLRCDRWCGSPRMQRGECSPDERIPVFYSGRCVHCTNVDEEQSLCDTRGDTSRSSGYGSSNYCGF